MDTAFAQRMNAMKPSSIREMLKMTERPDVISFAGGLPAPELFPVENIRAAAERVLGECGARAFQYGVSEGIAPLREQIAAEMSRRRVACAADDILITTGSQQALDLLGKVFIDAGDVILTETPTYMAAIQAFQCFQADFRPVATDELGVIPEAVDELAAEGRARFLYVIPNFQNPTGRTLSLERRRQLAEIAAHRNLLIVEDDPYGRLRYRGEHLPPIKSFDESGRVIYLSTFSKTVAPGFRTGWIVASGPMRDKLVIAKQAADLHTSSFDQLVLDRYLRDFDNRQHVERVCAAYGERYAVMDEALRRHMPEGFSWTRPEGGMFLWVSGPRTMNAMAVLAEALAAGVAFVPGADFFPRGGGENHMRLNFSNAGSEVIRDGIARLAAICARVEGD
ncbi:MAG: PLP-dependent aminotransferase family protein [Propionivibrio sp.]